jgi:hypothetical protein
MLSIIPQIPNHGAVKIELGRGLEDNKNVKIYQNVTSNSLKTF